MTNKRISVVLPTVRPKLFFTLVSYHSYLSELHFNGNVISKVLGKQPWRIYVYAWCQSTQFNIITTKLCAYFAGHCVSLIFICAFQKMPRSTLSIVSFIFLLFLLTCNICQSQQVSPRVFRPNFQSELRGLLYNHAGSNDGKNAADVIILPNDLFSKYPNVSVCFMQLLHTGIMVSFLNYELTSACPCIYIYIPSVVILSHDCVCEMVKWQCL